MERNFGKRWWRRRQRNRRDELEAEEDMKYDAFVSFSSHDEVWVLEEFAPKLEEQGQPRLRLCLHSRDFEVRQVKICIFIFMESTIDGNNASW